MLLMKIIAAADIHGSQYRLNIILENCEKYNPDLVVICGDITQFGPGSVALNLLNQIPQKTYAVTGNIDSVDVEAAINESQATNSNLKKIKTNQYSFIGLGGEHISSTMEIIENSTKKNITQLIDNKTVLITHIPPYGLQDSPYLGFHIGSKQLLSLIDLYHPALVLCGHVHENPGVCTYQDTVIVNCSIGKKGRGALIDLSDTITVTMLD
jgi:uncharacterized protein